MEELERPSDPGVAGDAPPPSEPVEPERDNAQQFGDMLDAEEAVGRPQRGGLLEGVIVSVSADEIVVDVGVKREALVLQQESRRMPPAELACLSPGTHVQVMVLNPRDADGNLVVSIERARAMRDWQLAEEYFKKGELWPGVVIGSNKGGLVIEFGQLQGFVPTSHLTGFPRYLAVEEKAQRLRGMLQKCLQLKVIEVDRERRRLVLSERLGRKEAQLEAKAQLMGQLRLGDVMRGTVRSMQPFGAFVDIGGADGLVHVSEISWQRVEDPHQVLHVGEQMNVQIVRLDMEHQRIGLSIKRLLPEPWTRVEQMFARGQVVRGVVTRMAAFGAFVEVGPGIEGLIHLSELSPKPVKNPSEVVSPRQVVAVRIVRIEPDHRRMALSLTQVGPDEARLVLGDQESKAPVEAPRQEEAPLIPPDEEGEEEFLASELLEPSPPAEEPPEEPTVSPPEQLAPPGPPAGTPLLSPPASDPPAELGDLAPADR